MTSGSGLQGQEDDIRAWARAHGHRVVAVHREEGVSGALEDRPALADALDDLRADHADGLVVVRLDRLARDLVVQESLLREVRRLDRQLFSVADGEDAYLADDPADPSRRLIRHVLGAVSDYERAMIALRLSSGRRRKHERGGYAYGAPRLGTRAEAGALVEDPKEAAAIERMRTLRDGGSSLREIVRVLDEERFRTKRGARWHPQTVARALATAAETGQERT